VSVRAGVAATVVEAARAAPILTVRRGPRSGARDGKKPSVNQERDQDGLPARPGVRRHAAIGRAQCAAIKEDR
jgi:hypothetical protein